MEKNTRIFDWPKRMWREHRPFTLSIILLVVGVPLAILIAPPKDTKTTSVDGAIKQAQQAAEKGDYAHAYKNLKSAAGQAKTNDQKVALYTELAAAAANAGKPREAINYLNLKHQLDTASKGADAYMLGSLYEQTGDKTAAANSYQAALDYYRSQPKNSTTDATIESLQAILSGLGAGDE
jgi:predicted negative regulator of RcsB-dependent stress response